MEFQKWKMKREMTLVAKSGKVICVNQLKYL